jgi:valyl-tRNA synthetase
VNFLLLSLIYSTSIFSALWPFSTLGWPDVSAEDFKKFYPTTMLETGYVLLLLTLAALVCFCPFILAVV